VFFRKLVHEEMTLCHLVLKAEEKFLKIGEAGFDLF
jgi:hypothetical protein